MTVAIDRPERFARHELGSQPRPGGQATVEKYRVIPNPYDREIAVDEGTLIAVKRPHSTVSDARALLSREVEIRRVLAGCPYVGDLVYDAMSRPADPWFAYRWAEGPTLDDFRRMPQVTVGDRDRVVDHVRIAANDLHIRGVHHRDLKPQNVIVDADRTVRLIDLGSAYSSKVSPFTTVMGPRQIGTDGFMCPEAYLDTGYANHLGIEADAWAWACVATLVFTDHLPHEASDPARRRRMVLEGAEPNLDGVPPKHHALLRACLDRDAEYRVQAFRDGHPPVRRIVVTESLARNPPAPELTPARQDSRSAGSEQPDPADDTSALNFVVGSVAILASVFGMVKGTAGAVSGSWWQQNMHWGGMLFDSHVLYAVDRPGPIATVVWFAVQALSALWCAWYTGGENRQLRLGESRRAGPYLSFGITVLACLSLPASMLYLHQSFEYGDAARTTGSPSTTVVVTPVPVLSPTLSVPTAFTPLPSCTGKLGSAPCRTTRGTGSFVEAAVQKKPISWRAGFWILVGAPFVVLHGVAQRFLQLIENDRRALARAGR